MAIKVALARNIWNSTRSAPPHLPPFDDSQIVRTLENVLEMLCQEGSRNNFNLFAVVTRCNRKNVSARKINNEHFVQSMLNIFNYSYIIIRSSHQRH